MELNFKIQGDRLIEGSVLKGNTGSMNSYICKFDITEMIGHIWYCVFKNNKSAYKQLIQDGKCVLPNELLKSTGNIQIGCYGTNGDERISTNWLTFSVNEGAYCEATAPDEPAPDVWEELVINSIPQIGESGNWYVYDIKKGEYVDSGMPSQGEKGEKGDKGDAGENGVLTEKYFPIEPQIDITTEELVRYIDVETIDGVALSKYGFTCAKVLLKNLPQLEKKSTELQVKLNKSNIYLSAPTDFLYDSTQKYWAGHFDITNCLSLGQAIAVGNEKWKATAAIGADPAIFTLLTNITAFRFQSILQDIPVGTNIKIWLK